MKRVIFDVVFFLSLFTFPWWVVVILAFLGIFLFNNFIEFIISGVVIYALYVIPGKGFINSPIYFSLIILLLYIIIQAFRSRIILYKNDFSY